MSKLQKSYKTDLDKIQLKNVEERSIFTNKLFKFFKVNTRNCISKI